MAKQKQGFLLPNINAFPVLRKWVTVGMASLLMLLTVANFFYYSDSEKPAYAISDADGPIQGPVEEKAGSNGFSLLEEMMHDLQNHFGLTNFDALREYIIDKGKELPCVHFELISPPPELIS